MPAEGSKGAVRRFYTELDQRHGAAVAEFVTTGFVAHLAGRDDLDRAGFAAALDGLYAAFPDLEHVVEDLVAEGERVVARLTERGTHRGVFQGVAPTGAVVTMAAIGVHRFVDGQLAELWMVADALGRLRQIGGLPD